MEDKIFEAIAGWAKIPTWYTSHPLDEKRFNEAIEELVLTVGTDIERSQFERALRKHAKAAPELLGHPSQSEMNKIISAYTDKAMALLRLRSI